MTPPLRIGVLGAAKISPPALLQPALDTEGVEVTVIAARDPHRAEAQADAYDIDTVVENYEDVIASDVDAIYNPLPISAHHAWTIAALRAGKHVLCEKPLASNATEAAEMVAVADEMGLVLVEAFHWRFHPLATRIREILDSNVLGPITRIDAAFTVEIPPDNAVRQSWELSGGALMDLGCYPVQWARFASGEQPEVVRAEMTAGQPNVDIITDIDVRYPKLGASGRLHTAMNPGVETANWLEVEGERGLLYVENPLAPHMGHSIRLRLAGTIAEDTDTTETVDGKTTYHHQLEAFRDAIVSGVTVPTGGSDSIETMQVIDAAYIAAGFPLRGT